MHEIESWIEDAAKHQRIPIRKLAEEEARPVLHEAMSRYVTISNPRVWWVNLATPIDEHYDRNTVELSNIIPGRSGSCWLIPETAAQHPPLYELDVTLVEKLINDCPGFEYNVLAKDFSWLVIETDHDQYYVCRL